VLIAAPDITAADLTDAAETLIDFDPDSTAAAAEWLVKVTADPAADPWTRTRAADQLAQLPSPHRPHGIDMLRTALNDPDPHLRVWAAQRLAKCGDEYRTVALAALEQDDGLGA
jgi:hypothetical protein